MSELRSLVETHYAGVNSGDVDKAASVFSDDVETIDPGAGRMRGLAAFREFGAAFNRAFPDGKLNIGSTAEQGGTIVVEGTYTGTNTGPLSSPQGEIPATGRTLALRYCDVLEVRQGKCVSHRLYYDQVELLTQLGLMPAATGP